MIERLVAEYVLMAASEESYNKKEFFSNYSKIARKVSKHKIGSNSEVDSLLQEVIKKMSQLKKAFGVED